MINDTKPIDAILEGLQGLFQQVDQAFHAISKRHPREFSCKKGCADCCNAFFDVSYVEAVALHKGWGKLPRKVKREVLKQAKKAMRQLERMSGHEDPSRVRIRCPLLMKGNVCALYELRPVNCRTYGVPTNFQGKAHVCPVSGFRLGERYTTLNLGPIQERLLMLSMEAGATRLGAARFTIADIILGQEGLFSPDH